MKSLALIFGLLLAGALASAQQFVTSTIAGTPGAAAYAGDAGPAINAQLNHPLCLTIDAQGNIYFVNSGNNLIRKITAATGVINTVAGTGTQGFAGDGGPALQAQFGSIDGLAADAQGNLYISDTTNSRVRMVNTSGIVSTVAGTGIQGGTGNLGRPSRPSWFIRQVWPSTPRGISISPISAMRPFAWSTRPEP